MFAYAKVYNRKKTMEKINAVITGVGGYVPDYILDNEEMSTIVETSDEWIMERIGVKTRHILKPEQGTGTSYMALDADDTAKFYRVEVYDVTSQYQVAIGNPIWND